MNRPVGLLVTAKSHLRQPVLSIGAPLTDCTRRPAFPERDGLANEHGALGQPGRKRHSSLGYTAMLLPGLLPLSAGNSNPWRGLASCLTTDGATSCDARVAACPSHRNSVLASRRRSNLPVDWCAAGSLHFVRNDEEYAWTLRERTAAELVLHDEGQSHGPPCSCQDASATSAIGKSLGTAISPMLKTESDCTAISGLIESICIIAQHAPVTIISVEE